MGQAEEFERLFNKYISEYKRCIKQDRTRKAVEEGVPPEIRQQVLKQVFKIIK